MHEIELAFRNLFVTPIYFDGEVYDCYDFNDVYEFIKKYKVEPHIEPSTKPLNRPHIKRELDVKEEGYAKVQRVYRFIFSHCDLYCCRVFSRMIMSKH